RAHRSPPSIRPGSDQSTSSASRPPMTGCSRASTPFDNTIFSGLHRQMARLREAFLPRLWTITRPGSNARATRARGMGLSRYGTVGRLPSDRRVALVAFGRRPPAFARAGVEGRALRRALRTSVAVLASVLLLSTPAPGAGEVAVPSISGPVTGPGSPS